MTSGDLPAFLHPFAPPTKQQFVDIVRGDGALLWDDDGNEYVDAMASLWYCAVGHGRQEIADASATQVGTLGRVLLLRSVHQPRRRASWPSELVALAPIPDARVFLCRLRDRRRSTQR